jgi:hypothetical protein
MIRAVLGGKRSEPALGRDIPPAARAAPAHNPRFQQTKADFDHYVATWADSFPSITFAQAPTPVKEGPKQNTTDHKLWLSELNNKPVHIKGYGDRPKRESIPKEMAFLKICKDAGIRTVSLLGYTRVEGENPAMVTEFVPGYLLKLAPGGVGKFRTNSPRGMITVETRRQILEAIDKLEAAGIEPEDLQFIVDPKGDAYLVDTSRFYFRGQANRAGRPDTYQIDFMRQRYIEFFQRALRSTP